MSSISQRVRPCFVNSRGRSRPEGPRSTGGVPASQISIRPRVGSRRSCGIANPVCPDATRLILVIAQGVGTRTIAVARYSPIRGTLSIF